MLAQLGGQFGSAFGLANWVGARPWTSPSPAPNSIFGIQIEGGDFDGDGITDLAVGEAGANVAGALAAGQLHVFSGPSLSHSLTLSRPGNEIADGALFGFAAAAGDIDGDGKDDLVVGAPAAIVSGIEQVGEAWVYFGPLPGTPVLIRDIHPTGTSAFGCRIELADLVGDARLDVIVGAPGAAGSVSVAPGLRVGETQVFDGAGSEELIVVAPGAGAGRATVINL